MTTAISHIDSPYNVLQFVDNGMKITDIKFYLEDCITGMCAHLQDKAVDVCVTSPPYNIGVNYGNSGYNDNKLESEYLAWIERVGIEIERVLKDDGSFFLNIGSSPTNPWKQMDVAYALRKHFVLQNKIHWIKSMFIPRKHVGKKNRSYIKRHNHRS